MPNPNRALLAALMCLAVAAEAAGRSGKAVDRRRGKSPARRGVTSIAPGPVPGLYEVMLGPSVLYISEDGRYIIKGDVFDLKSLDNVTGIRRNEARAAAFDRADDVIEFAPEGETKRVLYVYTDIDCGYCRKLHLEVEAAERGRDRGAVSRLSEVRDRRRVVRQGRGGVVREESPHGDDGFEAGKAVRSKKCPNPVSSHYRLGEAMGVRGTPAVYTEQGESIGGYVPANDLIRLLLAREG